MSTNTLGWMGRVSLVAASLPRFRVASKGADGSRLVVDRASNRRFQVYTPRFRFQFEGGHRAGLWYVRPVEKAGPSPKGPGYPSARSAIDALCSHLAR